MAYEFNAIEQIHADIPDAQDFQRVHCCCDQGANERADGDLLICEVRRSGATRFCDGFRR